MPMEKFWPLLVAGNILVTEGKYTCLSRSFPKHSALLWSHVRDKVKKLDLVI